MQYNTTKLGLHSDMLINLLCTMIMLSQGYAQFVIKMDRTCVKSNVIFLQLIRDIPNKKKTIMFITILKEENLRW